MSAAASRRSKRAAGGGDGGGGGKPRNSHFVMVPNVIVENIQLLTHAELVLALAVMKRATTPGEAVTISDVTWLKWTGLTGRSKELAIKGLRSKGLVVEGKGDAAKYCFNTDSWREFVRSHPRGKAKTAKPVAPKRGAKVHPACRDRGCALMAQEAAANGELTQVLGLPVAKDISQSCSGSQGRVEAGTTNSLPVPADTGNAKDISQLGSIENEFSQTLAAMQAFFPMVGVDFLAKLVDVVRGNVKKATDTEVAQAVLLSYRRAQARSGGQKSEGLFLYTVPEAVGAVRRAKVNSDAARVNSARNCLARLVQRLGDAGEHFAGFADEVRSLVSSVKQTQDLESLDAKLGAIEARVFDVVDAQLAPSRKRSIAERIASNMEFLSRQLAPHEIEPLQAAQLREYSLQEFDLAKFTWE